VGKFAPFRLREREAILKLGILGGTFDPIHVGHLITAEEIGRELRLEKVYLIPSASPPHKTGEPVTPFVHRLAMARIAATGSELLRVHDLEGKRPGFSYSIETLRSFHGNLEPGSDIFFILGIDAFMEIGTWKDYRRLFDYAHFVIAKRPGVEGEKLEAFIASLGDLFDSKQKPIKNHEGLRYTFQSGKKLLIMDVPQIDISSTKIRSLIREGKSIRFLVPDPVWHYIREEGLYRT
jgi:nicotinate-nucleotide adenylyltransferase